MEDDFDFAASSNLDGVEEPMDIPGDDDDEPVGSALKVGEEKAIGKSGLKKKLVREGESWETPSSGDEVEGKLIVDSIDLIINACLSV